MFKFTVGEALKASSRVGISERGWCCLGPVQTGPVGRARSSGDAQVRTLCRARVVPGPPSPQSGQKRREQLTDAQQPPGDGVGGLTLVLGSPQGTLPGWGAAPPGAMAFLQPETSASTPRSPGFVWLFSASTAFDVGSDTSWHTKSISPKQGGRRGQAFPSQCQRTQECWE